MLNLLKLGKAGMYGTFAASLLLLSCGNDQNSTDDGKKTTDNKPVEKSDNTDQPVEEPNCSGHSDCKQGFYCDKSNTKKCKKQEANGFKVSDLTDMRVCESQVISVDGYCCDTLCNSATVECESACSIKTSGVSCSSGTCSAVSPTTTPVEAGKICVNNEIISVSKEHNCGTEISGDACNKLTIYHSCDSATGACRTGTDDPNAITETVNAVTGHYFAEDGSDVDGYIPSEVSACDPTYNRTGASTCDGSGNVKYVSLTCDGPGCTGECKEKCSADTDCPVCHKCSDETGKCEPQKDGTDPSRCTGSTAHCVDGKCCDYKNQCY